MIQRIQSVYLLLAVALSIVCLCLPVGLFSIHGYTVGVEYNLWLSDIMGNHYYALWPMFAVLVLSSVIGLYTIFMYTNRKLQARMCGFNMLLLLGWYILYAVYAQVATVGLKALPAMVKMFDLSFSFRPEIAAVLPAVAIILYLMARRSILADEKLVRAADRIR